MDTFRQINRQPHKQEAGFTLVEIMVALALAAIALVGSTENIRDSLRLDTLTQHKVMAHHLASQRHTQLRLAHTCPQAKIPAQVRYRNQDWSIQQNISVAAYNRLTLVTVEVRRDPQDKKPLVSMASYHHCAGASTS